MKKTVIILLLSIILLSVYARGVTENVAKDGIKGVSNYIGNLEKAYTDESIPQEAREKVYEEVYKGRSVENALADYYLEMESMSDASQEESKQEEEDSIESSIEDEKEESVVTPPGHDDSEERAVYTGRLEWKGISSDVSIYSSHASFTIPSLMTDDDFARLLEYVINRYSVEAEMMDYSISGDVIEISYPEQREEYLLSVFNCLLSKAKAYIDNLLSPAMSQTSGEKREYSSEEELDLSTTFSYLGIVSSISVHNSYATFTVPDGFENEDIEAAAAMICRSYPEESSLVTYSMENGIVTISYPEQTALFLNKALNALLNEAVSLIDEMMMSLSSGEEGSYTEEAPVTQFKCTFSYRGIRAELIVGESGSVIVLPSGITKEDISFLASSLSAAFPSETANVSYTLDESVMTLTYPKQTSEYLMEYVSKLFIETEHLIDSLLDGNAEENSDEEILSASDSYVSEAEITEAEITEAEITEEEITEAPVSEAMAADVPVSSSEEEKKKSFVFSFDISLGTRGRFTYYKGSDHIYPTASASMRETMFRFVYLEAGGDVFAYKTDTTLFIAGGVFLNGGINFDIGNFDAFLYGGLRYQLTSASSSFDSGFQLSCGAGLDWRITNHVILGGGYEYLNAVHMFNVSLKLRF